MIIPLILQITSCKKVECSSCDYKSDWEGELNDTNGYIGFDVVRDANGGSITIEFKVSREHITGDLVKEGRIMVYVHHSYGDVAYDSDESKAYKMDEQAEFLTENVASERYYEYLSLNGEPGWICTFTGNYSKNCEIGNNELPTFKLAIKDINPDEGAKFNIWIDIDGPHSMDNGRKMILII